MNYNYQLLCYIRTIQFVYIQKLANHSILNGAFPRKFTNFSEAAIGCFMRKAVLKNFAIFTATLQACNFFKNRLQHRRFPLNIAKFLKYLFRRTSANGCFGFFNPIQDRLLRGGLRMGGGPSLKSVTHILQ